MVSNTSVQPQPIETARIKIEILFGERVTFHEDLGEWSRITTCIGSYEGFVKTVHLGECFDVTHRISERTAPLYNESYFKSPRSDEPLYFNSLIAIEESKETDEGVMHKVRGSGWIFDTHIRPFDERASDYVEECLKFLSTAYGYEKRAALIDCSTLVQAGCIAAGIECPYDVKSGDMEKLGEAVEVQPDFSNLKRGDLVFWTKDKGSHVAIMVDSTNCLHATIASPYRCALIQPLTEVAHDQARDHNGPITSVRRFKGYQ